MLFNIYINQFAYINQNIHISIEAICVLNMMQQKIPLTEFQSQTIKEEGILYFWFSHSLVKEELPILFNGAESDEAVSKKVRRWISELENYGLIARYPNAKGIKKSMYALTAIADKITKINPDKNVQQSSETDKNVRVNDAQTDKNVHLRRTKMSESSAVQTDKNVREEYIPINRELYHKEYISNSDFEKSELCKIPIVETIEEKPKLQKEKSSAKKEKTRAQILKEERNAKTRTHLHQDFIAILDNFQEKVKGQKIPASLWKMEAGAAEKIREVFVDLTEKKIPNATDQNILDSIELFLDILSKNLTPIDIQNMKPRYLYSKLIDFIPRVKNAHNGKANSKSKSVTPSEQELVNKHFAGLSKRV